MRVYDTLAQKVIDILTENGFKAYYVGGCVRDTLMNIKPTDYDLCTDALPDETMECLKEFSVIKTGIKHGTVTALVDSSPIEITTLRCDGSYSDHRRPDKVLFTKDLSEDLKRRDFTVNAMAYGYEKLFDYFGGADDILNKIIKCVGNAEKRFNEDALRIMRALRFASTLGFTIEEKTSAAICRNKHLLSDIAAERIFKEFSKLVISDYAAYILEEYNEVFNVIFPFEIHIENLTNMPHDPAVRFAALFEDNTFSACKILKTSNKFLRESCFIADHLKDKTYSRREVKLLLCENSVQSVKKLLGINGECLETLFDILKNNECFSLNTLAINGNDLIKLGIENSNIGRILHELLLYVIDNSSMNERNILIKKAIDLSKKRNFVI